MKKKERCVLVLSGGPDSATVAYWAKNLGYSVHGISFKYGQIATKEIEYAKLIAKKLDIPIKIIDLSSLKDIFTGVTALCDEDIEMTSTFSPPIIVPFRNAIFLSIAVAYATAIDAETILYGAQGSDRQFYPDCRRQFYKAFEKTAKKGTEKEINIQAPFSESSKAEVIKTGSKLGVPFKLTWSCYFSGTKHCGTCESCINRKKAFKKAKIPDPTKYRQ